MPTSVGVSPHETSTIVRSSGLLWRQRLTLAGVGSLSHVAPGAAAWAAERLFLTPPRHAAPERERDLLTRARPGTVRVDGRRLATWTWGAGPRILLAHGWGGRGAQLGAFVEPLVANGFSVAWFDGPAHGASEGRLATIPEMARALCGVVAALGPVRGIIAHSGGGVVSGWAIRRWLLDGFVDLPKAVALIAPPAGFRGYLERFSDACGLTAGARDRLNRRLTARAGVPPEALDLSRFAGDLPLAALVVHDREDAEVPWAEGAAIAAAWPEAELVTTRGLGHRRILRDPAVVARVTAFLTDRLARGSRFAGEPADLATLC
jgi:TAP-like protein